MGHAYLITQYLKWVNILRRMLTEESVSLGSKPITVWYEYRDLRLVETNARYYIVRNNENAFPLNNDHVKELRYLGVLSMC